MQTLSIYVGQERMTCCERSNAMCSSRKYPYPPTESTFALDPHPPWNFHSRGCLSYPPPPGIVVIFQLGWVPCGKNFSVKNAVALYYYAKDIFFCDKMRINRFIHVNTVSNNLKDFLSW